ncbi:GntR family transcriptional regulator [Ramlibacter sp. G-1-2-2]|uniref:GntR family transcriptional regulator n=1 Tax=Ramlibacter agri TaxID=2728837 RepID=A0A848HD03_9BURK|nr:GntR family transcriptional regulator [Ramlibacter agri]NML48307.1 GntR family transcriptional regulator [Ramlibacter agri]
MATSKTPAAGLRLVKTSLAGLAYDELKRQILDQRLRPGERLNIDALSRECGVSSSPLREALVKLGGEGLVVFEANTGFRVAPVPDEAQMKHLLEFRTVLESHGARVGAALANEDSLAAMRKATDGMAAMRAKGVSYKQYRAYFELEQAFHQALVDSAANPVISAAYRELQLVLLVARMSIVPDSNKLGSDAAVDEHRAIIAAFEARDPDAAEAAVQGHIQAARQRMKPQPATGERLAGSA